MSKTKRKDGAMYKTLFKIRLKQLVELLEEVENEIH